MDSWQAQSEWIEVHHDREVAVITLTRSDKLNALTTQMRKDLASALRYYGDGHRARGIVLTGTGRAFSAGEDLSTTNEADGTDGLRKAIETFHDITRAALESKVPTVAALNGLAVGGACEMTLCFDTRIGTPHAAFYLPENGIGLVISNASSLLLRRLIGQAGATRFVLGSQRIAAAAAVEAGMLDEIVEVEKDLLDTAVTRLLSWTQPGSSTSAHLQLLRPAMREIEQAMEQETAAAEEAWQNGISSAGIRRFWASRKTTEAR